MKLPLLSVQTSIGSGEPQATVLVPTTIRKLVKGKPEKFLEELIGKAPSLLGLEDLRTNVQPPYAAFHQVLLETAFGNTIRPDIVFLTGNGHVVVVEVKVAGNDELKGRKVVGQLIDYAGALARYPADGLASLFDPELPPDARFSDVVRKHLGVTEGAADVADVIVRRIKAAAIHLVIACDEAPEGLHETVASVTAQQALGAYQLRVSELVPYVDPAKPEAGIHLVPSVTTQTQIVARTVVEVKAGTDGLPYMTAATTPQDQLEANLAAAAAGMPPPTQPEILAAAAAYDAVKEPGTRVVGKASNYRLVYVDDWPGGVHYEFIRVKSQNTIGVELHFESDKSLLAADAVREAGLAPTPELPGLAWDQKWSTGRGRLRVLFPDTTAPEVLAKTMVALIRATRTIVSKALPL